MVERSWERVTIFVHSVVHGPEDTEWSLVIRNEIIAGVIHDVRDLSDIWHNNCQLNTLTKYWTTSFLCAPTKIYENESLECSI